MSLPRLEEFKVTLSTEDAARIPGAFAVIQKILANKVDKKMKDLAHKVTGFNAEEQKFDDKGFDHKTLIVLCQQQNSLDLIHFLRTHPYLNEKLQEKLKANNKPEVELKTSDASRIYSLFDLYLASLFLKAFQEGGAPDRTNSDLDSACSLGSLDALLVRIEINTKVVKAKGSADAYQAVKDDVQRMANLYWSAGYAYGAACLRDLALYFKRAGNEAEQKNCNEAAVRNCICAELLEKYPYSTKLLASVTQNKGFSFILEKTDLNFTSWPAAKNKLTEWAGGTVNFNKQDLDAQNELFDKSKSRWERANESKEEKFIRIDKQINKLMITDAGSFIANDFAKFITTISSYSEKDKKEMMIRYFFTAELLKQGPEIDKDYDFSKPLYQLHDILSQLNVKADTWQAVETWLSKLVGDALFDQAYQDFTQQLDKIHTEGSGSSIEFSQLFPPVKENSSQISPQSPHVQVGLDIKK